VHLLVLLSELKYHFNEWIWNLPNKQLFTVIVERQGYRANDCCYQDLNCDAVFTADAIPNIVARKNTRCKIWLGSKLCWSVSRHLQEGTGKSYGNRSGKTATPVRAPNRVSPKNRRVGTTDKPRQHYEMKEGIEKRCHMKVSVTLNLTVHSVGIRRQSGVISMSRLCNSSFKKRCGH
jgi:hypothetical protein